MKGNVAPILDRMRTYLAVYPDSTAKEIAAALACSQGRVQQVAKEEGIALPTRESRIANYLRAHPGTTLEVVAEATRQNRRTIAAVAAQCGITLAEPPSGAPAEPQAPEASGGHTTAAEQMDAMYHDSRMRVEKRLVRHEFRELHQDATWQNQIRTLAEQRVVHRWLSRYIRVMVKRGPPGKDDAKWIREHRAAALAIRELERDLREAQRRLREAAPAAGGVNWADALKARRAALQKAGNA